MTFRREDASGLASHMGGQFGHRRNGFTSCPVLQGTEAKLDYSIGGEFFFLGKRRVSAAPAIGQILLSKASDKPVSTILECVAAMVGRLDSFFWLFSLTWAGRNPNLKIGCALGREIVLQIKSAA